MTIGCQKEFFVLICFHKNRNICAFCRSRVMILSYCRSNFTTNVLFHIFVMPTHFCIKLGLMVDPGTKQLANIYLAEICNLVRKIMRLPTQFKTWSIKIHLLSIHRHSVWHSENRTLIYNLWGIELKCWV